MIPRLATFLLLILAVTSQEDLNPRREEITNKRNINRELSKLQTPKQTAKLLHKQALGYAKGGDLTESLKFFRAAVRGNSKNLEYLNNLGVTEMRLGLFLKAKLRFLCILVKQHKIAF